MTDAQDDRPQRGTEGIAAILRRRAQENGADEASALMTDMLADALHYCNQHSIDFDELLNTARGHYAEEVGVAVVADSVS